TVRRTPCRSMPTLIVSCSAPNAKWKMPAKRPSCCVDSAKSRCSAGAMIAAIVRQAWLSVKPPVSASSISQLARAEADGAADGADGRGSEGEGMGWGGSAACTPADGRTIPFGKRRRAAFGGRLHRCLPPACARVYTFAHADTEPTHDHDHDDPAGAGNQGATGPPGRRDATQQVLSRRRGDPPVRRTERVAGGRDPRGLG